MAMSVDSIRRVADKNTYLLLKEPLFYIEGREAELLNVNELKQHRLVHTAGVNPEDVLDEGTVMMRNVSQMVNYVKNDNDPIDFRLTNYRDARLIYTIIDTFLQAQARLLTGRLGGIKDDMLEDFHNLTKLANLMLGYIDINDRIDLMNAPADIEVTYENIFEQLMHQLNELPTMDSNVSIKNSEEVNDRGFKSPFTELLNRRSHVNRINRFD